jgi:hypothetical protein
MKQHRSLMRRRSAQNSSLLHAARGVRALQFCATRERSFGRSRDQRGVIKRANGATSTSIGRSRFAEPETIGLPKMPGLIPSRLRQRRRRVTRSETSSSSASLDPAPHVLKRTKRPGDKKSCVAVEPKASFGKSASHFRSTPISGPFHRPPPLRIRAKFGLSTATRKGLLDSPRRLGRKTVVARSVGLL